MEITDEFCNIELGKYEKNGLLKENEPYLSRNIVILYL